MRKIILYILLISLVIFSVFIVYKGIPEIKIESYSSISQENKKLNNLITEANNQKEVEYKKKSDALNTAHKLLESNKESYQELLEIGVDSNGIPLSKIQEYEIEKIWITIGNYAKKEGVDVKMEITSNNSVAGTYDLNFTASGSYTSIEDFLRDLQGDNTLVFKIENFKLVAGGTRSSSNNTAGNTTENTASDESAGILTATFVCEDIKLNIVENSTNVENDSSTGSHTTTSTSEATNTTTSTNNSSSTASTSTKTSTTQN
mgnify:CR=1 FL=1